MSKTERIDKILSNLGYGSRKDIKSFIKKGLITINGEIIKDNSIKIDPFNSEIKVKGVTINYKENIYIMMNKPNGVISSTFDKINKTVIDLLDKKYKTFKPFPIGRLDKDTEGLLIISNDGELAHNLLSPKKHVNKTYYVEVSLDITDKDIELFNDGVYIGDYKTMPAELKIVDNNDKCKAIIVIKEGKFHQIKRMFNSVGKEVLYLKRIKMGNLELDNSLKPGNYRELSVEELEILKNSR